jgi:hypothetical protein
MQKTSVVSIVAGWTVVIGAMLLGARANAQTAAAEQTQAGQSTNAAAGEQQGVPVTLTLRSAI